MRLAPDILMVLGINEYGTFVGRRLWGWPDHTLQNL